MKEIASRVNQYLLLAILLVIVLLYGKVVLIPIVFAAMLAMLMAPICRRLDKWGAHRGVSSFVCIFILLIVLSGMLLIVIAEISSFADEFATIEKKADDLLSQAQEFVESTFGVEPERQIVIVKEQIKSFGKSAGSYAGKLVAGLTSTIAGLLLTLVFTFLFLYNKERYEQFILKLYKDEEPGKIKKVVGEITVVAQKYLTGRATSIMILWFLYSIGLLIVGVKNAILLAGVAALLTVIPYVGSTLGGMFPFMMALITEDSFRPALGVAGVIIFIQAMDNYFIEPNVVGGEVALSAQASILTILVGGLIWGVAGMILFIPVLGIAKIIFDHVEPLKPLGYIIGDPDAKKPSKIKMWIMEKLGKTKNTSSRKRSVNS
ncbi:AI-2E family transporter [Ohtaekwangia koreensis]|uniref:Predicted PurR-regulated permease PerM n=1 Tax=Ohtaekwangia koreensis TaxID=688867 RepID=A0A1T5MMP8_9BACT|nr:AI-2E family transporter [Ohtaekwangia koreensis]SKC89149.1 Predicted PurR-regulated permease PerM [Ohtaekwangia koreensis]